MFQSNGEVCFVSHSRECVSAMRRFILSVTPVPAVVVQRSGFVRVQITANVILC